MIRHRRPALAGLLALIAGTVIAACALSATPAEPSKEPVRQLPPPEERWAIVAGVGAYQDPFPPLHGDEDAKEFARALEEHAGFRNDHIVLLAGEHTRDCRPVGPGSPAEKREGEEAAADCKFTRENLIKELHKVHPNAGLLVFFFSGHGEHVGGESVLFPWDLSYELKSQESYLKENGITARLFADGLKNRHVKQAMVFLDACRSVSGASKGERQNAKSAEFNRGFDLKGLGLQLDAWLTFYSTSETSPSYEDPNQRSYFAHELVRALDGRGDSYGPRNVLTLQALIDKVKENVRRRSEADEKGAQVPEPKPEGYLLPEVVLAGREAPTGSHPELLSGSSVLMTPDGKRVYVADSRRGAVIVFNTTGGQPGEVIDLRPGMPGKMVLAVRRGRLYVTEPVSRTVVIVDTATHQVVGRMPVGTNPESLALTPDETKLYVANQQPAPNGTISVLDPGGTGPIAKPIGGVNCPEGLAMAPDGKFLYVETQCGSGDDPLFVVNTHTDRVEASFLHFAVGGIGLGMVPNGEKLYVGTEKPDRTQVLITAVGDVKPVGKPGDSAAYARYFAVTPDGKYVLGVGGSRNLVFIDAITDEVLTPRDLGVPGAGIAIGMVPPTREGEPPHAACYIWLPDVPQLFFTGLDGILPLRKDPD